MRFLGSQKSKLIAGTSLILGLAGITLTSIFNAGKDLAQNPPAPALSGGLNLQPTQSGSNPAVSTRFTALTTATQSDFPNPQTTNVAGHFSIPKNALAGSNQPSKAPPSPAPASSPASKLYAVIDEAGKTRYSVNADQVSASDKLPGEGIDFDQTKLLKVLKSTLDYFAQYATVDPTLQHPGVLGKKGVSIPEVVATLEFMIQTLETDIQNGQPTRLKDPQFIQDHFRVMHWSAFNPEDKAQKQLRITKYAVFKHPASRSQTATFNTPLYGLTPAAVQDKTYLRYTKQEVLSGIFDKGGKEFGKAEALAYLSRAGFEDALLQGTVLLDFPDGSQQYVNVDRNNGIPYVRGVGQPYQKRFWYFKNTDGIKGYGGKDLPKISIQPGVTFAGDVNNVGLGRIVALAYTSNKQKKLRLGVIGDTGGAFLPNLHQLDWLAGTFKNREEFWQAAREIPDYVDAYWLIKKP